MGRHEDTGLGRRRRIARDLGLEEKGKPGQFQGTCPICGRPGFSIMRPDDADWLHIWVCAAGRRHQCTEAAIRGWMLRRFPSRWIGGYGLDTKAGADPVAAARLGEAVDLVLDWPQLKPSTLRIMLAEARGHKVPDDFGEFVKFAQRVCGIGRRQAYEAAADWCRSSSVPHPGGRSADAKS